MSESLAGLHRNELTGDCNFRLNALLQAQLRNAVSARVDNLRTYESLRNLSEVIGGEYGDRVIFELFQNAHDAHVAGNDGEILLRLVVHGPEEGDLYIANRGQGFTWENVEAIRNIAVSSKSVGEGIGNKGLGFRSIEILTDNPQIFSQPTAVESERFEGYCFRFAKPDEVFRMALPVAKGNAELARGVAETLPRYLATVPMAEQSADVRGFAKQGFSTVIHVPLKSSAAVTVAEEQVLKLQAAEAPLLLFLERLRRVVIEVDRNGDEMRKELSRSVETSIDISGSPNTYQLVQIHPGNRRYVLAKRKIGKDQLQAAIKESLPKEPQLGRWLDWKGDAYVSVAIGLGHHFESGRIYNFLPMAEEIASPIKGHVDAPFYATIDRRRVNIELPLNAFLMNELAVTSARSALDLMGHTQLIGRNPIFDFGAWDPADKARLAACWQRLKRDWSNVPIVPDADGVSWCSLREAWIWDDKEYRQFRVSKLVKAGVLKIASPNLGTNRLPRFRQLTTILGRQSSPPREILAAWTAALAQRLFDEKAGARSWASFYADISRALKTTDDLGALKNVSFLIGRGDKLFKPAAAQGEMPVFVRPTETQKRDRARAPLPPSIFARQFAIFNDDVVLKPDVLERFLRAGLLKRYDPVDIIQGIGSVLSKPSPARLEAAIVWAFNIWRAEPARLSKVLSTVGLLVEARKGWLAPNLVHFSDGWTPLGKKVDMYLAEGAVLSDDCRHASERLLVAEPAWVSRTTATRSDWINFLRVLGVQDSLPLLSDDARSEGRPDWHWGSFLREEKPAIGRDRNWILSNPNSTLPNPQTNYQRQGELLRIPGQVEYEQLHADARERLADLILAKITDTDTAWQHFKLGRYDRHIADRNEREFTTPAWSFILGAAWVPVNADDGSTSFMRLDDLWHSSDGRQKAPRFLIRPTERTVRFLEDNENVAKRLFAARPGLLDWADAKLASRKLSDMAAAVSTLEPRERVNFRRAYHRVLQQAAEGGLELTPDTPLVVSQGAALTILHGTPAAAPIVYVTSDSQLPEAKAVSAAGLSLLDVGEDALVGPVLQLLERRQLFEARKAEVGQITVLVDGMPFAPNMSDPLLLKNGLEWLSEAVILANGLLGRELERQISNTVIEVRLRRVRIRYCGSIAFSVDDCAIDEKLSFYALDDENYPTLVVAGEPPMDWGMLGAMAPHLSTLLDRRMRSLETLLLRLAAQRASSMPQERPSDEALARVLSCKVDVVHEFTSSARTEESVVGDRLIPLLACFVGVDRAHAIMAQLVGGPARGAIANILEPLASTLPVPVGEFLDIALGRTELAQVRKLFDVGFRELNEVLTQLGKPTLSNEAELRRLFEVWKEELRPGTIDRLRRHFMANYRTGASLTPYVGLKALNFLHFQMHWIAEFEELDRGTVKALLDFELEGRIGPDSAGEVPDFKTVIEGNRRKLRHFVEAASPVVKAWCFSKQSPSALWNAGVLEVLKAVEATGLLDFEQIQKGGETAVLKRASIWPAGMPGNLEAAKADTQQAAVDASIEAHARHREALAKARRTVRIAGTDFDTADVDLSVQLTAFADKMMADNAWLARSKKRIRLQELPAKAPRNAFGGSGGGGRRTEGIPEDAKRTMGFISEYLASKYLVDKHGARFSDASWVSGNRGYALTDGHGDDTEGFDFRVRTKDVEWRYEVKSGLADNFEFEFTQNEMRSALECGNDRTRRYRILYVPFVFDPSKWKVVELPNPMQPDNSRLFQTIGKGSTRMKFLLE